MEKKRGLFLGGTILLFVFALFNGMNFLFQVLMARMLSLGDYATLASLLSVVYIVSIFSESIQTVVAKYSASEKDEGSLKNILKKSTRKAFRISLFALCAYLFAGIFVSRLLKIEYLLFAIVGVILVSSFTASSARGMMHGKKMFWSFGVNLIAEATIKLIVAFGLVYAGAQIYGAVTGVIIGSIAAGVLSFVPLRRIMDSEEKPSRTGGIRGYAKPTFWITFFTVAFYSLDVIIAKMVFTSEVAGAYAISSMISKVIFWGTQPISKAMFPMSAESEHSSKRRKIFSSALLFLLPMLALALVIFYFLPTLLVSLFAGRIVSESVSVLFLLGTAMAITSVTNLVMLYKLSIGKTRRYSLLTGAIILEIALLFYLSSSITTFSLGMVISSIFFLLMSAFVLGDNFK